MASTSSTIPGHRPISRAGGRYYPKLQTAVPFTPVAGPRFLVRPGFPEGEARAYLTAGAIETAKRQRASSWHVTFALQDEWQALGLSGLLRRTDNAISLAQSRL